MAPVPIIIFDSYGRQENTDGQKRRGKKKDAMYDIYSSLIPTYTHTTQMHAKRAAVVAIITSRWH